MLKIITFLGTVARKTVYRYQGQDYAGDVFGQAMCQFLDFDEMLVFVTEDARRMAYPVLEALEDPRIRPVDIPVAETSEELWQLFDALTSQVGVGDRVIFDITHGLRSIPFLVFLTAAYLRSVKEVTIEKVLYGALELGKGHPAAPVIELTELVTLLDWLTATNQFIYTGDARYLAHLLEQEGQSRSSKALQRAGADLSGFSLAMMLCRPLEVMEKAGGLGKTLANAQNELAQWARPFGLLAGRIEQEYAARALARPTQDVVEGLTIQLDLIRWYMGNNQVIHAMTLAREWLVTLTGCRLGWGLVLDKSRREKDGIAGEINQFCRLKSARESPAGLSFTASLIAQLPEADLLRRAWDKVTGIRNDLNHAGMGEQAALASRLARRASDVLPELQALFDKAVGQCLLEGAS